MILFKRYVGLYYIDFSNLNFKWAKNAVMSFDSFFSLPNIPGVSGMWLAPIVVSKV